MCTKFTLSISIIYLIILGIINYWNLKVLWNYFIKLRSSVKLIKLANIFRQEKPSSYSVLKFYFQRNNILNTMALSDLSLQSNKVKNLQSFHRFLTEEDLSLLRFILYSFSDLNRQKTAFLRFYYYLVINQYLINNYNRIG